MVYLLPGQCILCVDGVVRWIAKHGAKFRDHITGAGLYLPTVKYKQTAKAPLSHAGHVQRIGQVIPVDEYDRQCATVKSRPFDGVRQAARAASAPQLAQQFVSFASIPLRADVYTATYHIFSDYVYHAAHKPACAVHVVQLLLVTAEITVLHITAFCQHVVLAKAQLGRETLKSVTHAYGCGPGRTSFCLVRVNHLPMPPKCSSRGS